VCQRGGIIAVCALVARFHVSSFGVQKQKRLTFGVSL
jgi:hypothetical protein